MTIENLSLIPVALIGRNFLGLNGALALLKPAGLLSDRRRRAECEIAAMARPLEVVGIAAIIADRFGRGVDQSNVP